MTRPGTWLGINYTAWTGIVWTVGLIVQYNQPVALFAALVPFIIDECVDTFLSNFVFHMRMDDVKKKLHTQDATMMLISAVLFMLYAHAALTLNKSRTTRWHSYCTTAELAMLLHCASCVYELYLYGTIGAFSSGDLVLVQADEADPSKVVVLLHPSADDSNADGAVSNTSFEGARAFNAVGWRDPDGELVTAAKDIPLGMFRVARPPYGIQENGRLVTLEYVQDDGSFLKSPRRGLSFENPAAKELKFIVHHVATALAYEAALHVQQLVFFACCAGLVEGTNVFLQSITMLQRTKNKSHITYYVSGFMLWLSFLVLRVVFLPLLVYRFYLDMSAKPTKTIDKVSHAYAGMGISAVVGIWMLSCYWFASISKGLLKTLCGTGQKVAQD